MLNFMEDAGLRSILSLMTRADRRSLVGTITGGTFKFGTEQEIIDAIIVHAKDAIDILKRMKVKKDYLIKYLIAEKAVFRHNGTKADLIRACFENWSSRCQLVLAEVEDMDYDTIDDEEEEDNDDEDDEFPSSSSSSFNGFDSHSRKKRKNYVTSDEDATLAKLGQLFTSWFYSIIEKVNDDFTFGTQHFWPDCVFRMIGIFINGDEERVDRVGDRETVNIIREIINDKKIQFTPNIHNGVYAIRYEFGTVNICVKGIVYHEKIPIGYFQHEYGLICEQNQTENFKIKFIKMSLKFNACVDRNEEEESF